MRVKGPHQVAKRAPLVVKCLKCRCKGWVASERAMGKGPTEMNLLKVRTKNVDW